MLAPAGNSIYGSTLRGAWLTNVIFSYLIGSLALLKPYYFLVKAVHFVDS